ncbi:MAG: hypothetical protein HY040_03790 [Planctomycetes bacterium]|nr:hypothetical protein [Planctomycetota bacterium]
MAKKTTRATTALAKKSTGAVPRRRSPNYPAVSLPEGVQMMKKLIDRDGKAGAPLLAALKHMGFSSAHGQAMTIISALRKFKLIEEGNDRIVPTRLAIDIHQFPDNHPRKIQALRLAAFSPTIYRELLAQYQKHGNIPSDESLKPELITDKDFNPNAADRFIKDFRQSLSCAGLLDGSTLTLPEGLILSLENVGDDEGEASPAPKTTEPSEQARTQVETARHQLTFAQLRQGTLMREFPVTLPSLTIAVLKVPVPMTEEDFDSFAETLARMKKSLTRTAEKEGEVSGATEEPAG